MLCGYAIHKKRAKIVFFFDLGKFFQRKKTYYGVFRNE